MVGVFTYYCNEESSLTDIENLAQSESDVLFTSKGDKVIKVCSQSGFTTDKGISNCDYRTVFDTQFY